MSSPTDLQQSTSSSTTVSSSPYCSAPLPPVHPPPPPCSSASAVSAPLSSSSAVCAVCGEQNAKMHYGVLACLGCKGFFRRALKKLNEYECLRTNSCTIDKQDRNSCRSCRLQKCLDVGMDPAAVRPDRDLSSKHQKITRRHSQSSTSSSSSTRRAGRPTAAAAAEGEGGRRGEGEEGTACEGHGEGTRSWAQRLPVEMRTMLMTLQNIEAKVVRGDTAKDASEIYPLRINTIREVINDPAKLRGRRTEMRYEPYRMARNEELCAIVCRRLIAAIDWVELLAEWMGGLDTEDRIALVKACFGPLTLFKCSARTAIVTQKEDMLCLCNFAYVPREISKAYHDAYHLDNGLVERLLTELVTPFRRIHLLEEEVVCMSAIIVLNPMARDLTETAAEKCFQLRNRICTTLHQLVKECRSSEWNPNIRFGNMLLYLPIISSLANAMSENLRFAQTFSTLGGIPLLTSLFGCFPVEPFGESEMALCALPRRRGKEKEEGERGGEKEGKEKKKKKKRNKNGQKEWSDSGTQTEEKKEDRGGRKRRMVSVTNSVEEGWDEFRLLKAPCSYTLTEMFDDRINEEQQEEDGQAERGAEELIIREGLPWSPAGAIVPQQPPTRQIQQLYLGEPTIKQQIGPLPFPSNHWPCPQPRDPTSSSAGLFRYANPSKVQYPRFGFPSCYQPPSSAQSISPPLKSFQSLHNTKQKPNEPESPQPK